MSGTALLQLSSTQWNYRSILGLFRLNRTTQSLLEKYLHRKIVNPFVICRYKTSSSICSLYITSRHVDKKQWKRYETFRTIKTNNIFLGEIALCVVNRKKSLTKGLHNSCNGPTAYRNRLLLFSGKTRPVPLSFQVNLFPFMNYNQVGWVFFLVLYHVGASKDRRTKPQSNVTYT